ncbi:MAG: gliding motility-associated C-terminal domain-containing protein, partial [Maribacter sp.]|uniref:T9SS type B sorting domain-containing protein n=1 Tax=Maribacter sp. TaxID=1897614 RepID=UPI003C73745D
GEGTWTYDPATGEATFSPDPGFTTDPSVITYELTDLDTGLSDTAQVLIDYDIQPPVAMNDESLNNPSGSSVTLDILTNDMDPDGNLDPDAVNLIPPTGATNIVTDIDGDVIAFDVPGEGSWVYNPVNGEIAFSPEPGFLEGPTPIAYTVDDNDGNPSNISSIIVDYEAVADLSLAKRVVDNDVTPFIGTEITFEVSVTNDGPDDATGVIVTDLLPSGYDFILFSSTTGAYDETSGIWTVGNIASGLTEILLIDVLVNASGDYLNGAEVTASDIVDIDSDSNNDVLSEDDQDEVDVVPQQVPSVDLSVTKFADNMTPPVGSIITFSITVRNDGLSDATMVVVTDLLASGYQYQSSSLSTGTYEPLNGSWTVGDLLVGTFETMDILALVLPNGNYTNVAEVTDAAENDVDSTPANNDDTEDDQETIEPIPVLVSDLELTKVVDEATPFVGDEVIFTLSLTNNGPSDTNGVTVLDQLPDGYTYVSNNSTAGIYDQSTGLWSLNGVVPNGTTETLNIVSVVNPTGNYSNSAEITGSDNADIDSIPSNGLASEDDQDNADTTPTPLADLSLTKTVDNEFPDVSDTVTFTLTMNNAGPSEATGIQVNEALPSGYRYISDDSGGTYDSATGIWNVASLPADSSLDLNVTVGINTTGSYANVAELIAVNEQDPNSAPNNNDINEDDQDGQSTTPRVITDMSVVKTVDNQSPSVGSQITFTITVTNDGPSDATGIVIEDVLASGYDFISATTSAGTFDEVIGSWDIAALLNGASETLEITATVLTNGDFSNTAELIALDTFDPDSSPDNNLNSEDDQDTVNPVPTGLADLSLTKEANNLNPNVGDIVEFTINLTNSGDSNATGVVVTDVVPSGYTYQSHLSTAGVYDPATGVWNTNGVIPNGTTETLIVLLQVNSPTGDAEEYTNTAEITASDQADPDSNSNDDSTVDDLADGLEDDDEASVTVIPQSVDIAVTKAVNNERPKIGDAIQFTISVNNLGMSDATNLGIEEMLPSGYLYLNSQASVGIYDQIDGFWEIALLASTETATLTISVEVLQEDNYLNTAKLAFVDQIDLNGANDTGQATIDPTCLTIYNEFSPNDDGVNEFFKIDCISRYPNNVLRVYNRWGNIVFEQQNYDNTWTGLSNGRATISEQELLPVGTYYYILDLGDGSEPIADWLYINR